MATTSSTNELSEFNDLYLEQLRDLYSAENQIIKALPKLVEAATEPKLKEGFQLHLEQTREHTNRLQEIFSKIGEDPEGTTCKAMKGLIAEGDETLKDGKPGPVLDAALIAGAQRIEHYEIAAYGTVKTFAKHLGDKQAVSLLDQTLNEEKQTDEKLTAVAESVVNSKALKA